MDENERALIREEREERRRQNEREKEKEKKSDAYGVVCIFQAALCTILAIFFAVFTFSSSSAKEKLKSELNFLFEKSIIKTEGVQTVNAIKEFFGAPQNFLAVFSPVQGVESTTSAEVTETSESTQAQTTQEESSKNDETTAETTVNSKETTTEDELTDELTDEEAKEYFEKNEPVVSEASVNDGEVQTAALNFQASDSSALTLKKTSKKIISPVNSTNYTSEFGYRLNPITNKVAFHTGLDIAAAQGTKIKAAYSGTVRKTGEDSRSGKYVILSHNDDMETLYCHCSAVLVTQGAVIRQGETIALVGSTGWSTGPHLHFEVKQNGTRLDPKKLLSDK